MPECCTTLHVAVRSCNEGGPVEGADVVVEMGGEGVASGTTDDTGTVTLLVGEEGTYTVGAFYNDGHEEVSVEAECGINNVTVHFGLTDKVCVLVLEGGGDPPIDPFEFELFEEDGTTLVDSCTTDGEGRCCISIPGPGTYKDPEGVSIVVEEDDCGDRQHQFNIPGEVETVDRHVCVTLCGCPLVGAGVTVTIPGHGAYSGTTGGDGCATITIPEDAAGDWAGSSYAVTHEAIDGGSAGGTVSAEPHNVALEDAEDGYFCHDDCLFEPPDTLTATFSSTGSWDLHGMSITLHRIPGTNQYASGCQPVAGSIVQSVAVSAEPITSGPACNPTTVTWSVTVDAHTLPACGGPALNGYTFTESVADPYSATCPVNVWSFNDGNPARTFILSE